MSKEMLFEAVAESIIESDEDKAFEVLAQAEEQGVDLAELG